MMVGRLTLFYVMRAKIKDKPGLWLRLILFCVYMIEVNGCISIYSNFDKSNILGWFMKYGANRL